MIEQRSFWNDIQDLRSLVLKCLVSTLIVSRDMTRPKNFKIVLFRTMLEFSKLKFKSYIREDNVLKARKILFSKVKELSYTSNISKFFFWVKRIWNL